jgi:hypothetical protein
MQESVPSVEVFTMRPFTVRVKGSPLEFRGKVQRKPLELLKVLIAQGGTDVPEQMLSDALWPDADGDAAHRNFATTLHRLRHLIGFPTLRVRGARLTLDESGCWVDYRALGKLLEEAQAAGGDGEVEEGDRLRRALMLYQVPFLEGEFDPPEILVARERWHSQVLRLVSASPASLPSPYITGRSRGRGWK